MDQEAHAMTRPEEAVAHRRLQTLLANSDASVPEILELLQRCPEWIAGLLESATNARGSVVTDPSQALMLIGFVRTRHILNKLGPHPRASVKQKYLAE